MSMENIAILFKIDSLMKAINSMYCGAIMNIINGGFPIYISTMQTAYIILVPQRLH